MKHAIALLSVLLTLTSSAFAETFTVSREEAWLTFPNGACTVFDSFDPGLGEYLIEFSARVVSTEGEMVDNACAEFGVRFGSENYYNWLPIDHTLQTASIPEGPYYIVDDDSDHLVEFCWYLATIGSAPNVDWDIEFTYDLIPVE